MYQTRRRPARTTRCGYNPRPAAPSPPFTPSAFHPPEVSMRVVPSGRSLVTALVVLVAGALLTAATTPKVTFTDTRLKNGLRVLIAEDHAAPVFSIAVNYNVGSRDERKGRTGFAHLFEHMMFKGSANVGPGEHFLLIF